MIRLAYIVLGIVWFVVIVLRWLVSIYVSARELRKLSRLDQEL